MFSHDILMASHDQINPLYKCITEKNIFEQRNAAEDEISAAHYIIMCDSFLNCK